MRIILQYGGITLAVYRIAAEARSSSRVIRRVLILCAAFTYNNVSKVVIIL
jgi:hypothetical protein